MQQFSIFMCWFTIFHIARVENTNIVIEVTFLHLLFGESGLVNRKVPSSNPTRCLAGCRDPTSLRGSW